MNPAKPFSPKVKEILNKAQDMAGISHAEAVYLLRLDLCSAEAYAVMALANRMSRRSFAARASSTSTIGLNVEGCAYNCKFCSLTKQAGIFQGSEEFSRNSFWPGPRTARPRGPTP